MSRKRVLRFLIIGVLGIIVLGFAGVGAVSTINRLFKTGVSLAKAVAAIQAPPGFHVDVFADTDAFDISAITFGPDGKLYVLTVDGALYTVEDKDGDGRGETIRQVYANKDNLLAHSVGLTFHNDVLYISDSGRISTFTDSNNDGQYDTLTPIVKGLVTLHFSGHSNNGIIFGPDDKLYVGVGATTDHGPLTLPMEGAVLRMNADGSDLEQFADGFRNPYDLAFSPEGDLFTADNNPSELDRNLRYLPPEEFDWVKQGLNYGFPRVFGMPPVGDTSEAPLSAFYASVGSSGIVYYDGKQFPPAFRHGVFVAQWGTGASVALDRSIVNGFAVVFVPLPKGADGSYHTDWQPFIHFDPTLNLRPVDVTVDSKGSLYIGEFENGIIYRVTYDGDMSSIPTEQPTPDKPVDFPTDQVNAGEQIFKSGVNGAPACITCHLPGEQAGLGPKLAGLYQVAAQRVPGLSAADYVKQSIMTPNAYIVSGYNANYMYQNYANVLTSDQVDSLVDYVLSLKAGS